MFGIGDKRKADLKNSDKPFAARGLELYNEDNCAYKIFLAGSSSKDCWAEYKTWLKNWIAEDSIETDEQLYDLYIEWFEQEWFEQDETAKQRIKEMWLADANQGFDEKSDGQFFRFAAYIESL